MVKNFLIKTCLIIVFAAQSTFAGPKPTDYPIHILPDEPGTSYEMYNDAISVQSLPNFRKSYLDLAIQAGKRNLDWLKFMNQNRPDNDKLALTKPGELRSYPIDQPNRYSPKTVETDYKNIQNTIPEPMKTIIFGTGAFTQEPGLPLADYILWGKKIDRLYQTASRWNLITPYLSWYKTYKANDMRGYYYLNKESLLPQKLTNWLALSPDDQNRLSGYLVGICYNKTRNENDCKKSIQVAIQKNQIIDYYNQYFNDAQNLWESFFLLEGTRPDLVWTRENENLAVLPFRSTLAKVEDYLRVNIEDEWKWDNWQLRLNFIPTADVHVEFVPGATPHVNGIAGNTITMDDNAPLTEWDVQWTIRHEFGHVIGFPDCYIEFYDSDAQEMVNYQLDVTDLMCSRAGKLKQNHFDELKKGYLK